LLLVPQLGLFVVGWYNDQIGVIIKNMIRHIYSTIPIELIALQLELFKITYKTQFYLLKNQCDSCTLFVYHRNSTLHRPPHPTSLSTPDRFTRYLFLTVESTLNGLRGIGLVQ